MTLHLDDVTLTYPDGDQRLTALDHVSLTAEPGTLTAIVGPSGSGKSSLLAVAATLITPDSGQRPARRPRPRAAQPQPTPPTVRRQQIGIIFQSSNLLASLTALDQLLVIAHMDGRDMAMRRGARHGPARRRRTGRPGRQTPPSALRRAAAAGHHRPRPDEPALTASRRRTHQRPRHPARRSDLSLLRRLTIDRGLTTLMVTHNQDHVSTADRVTEIVDGRSRQRASW